MNVEWNQDERNTNAANDNNNTTSIVTGDFLSLFQSFGQPNNEQATIPGKIMKKKKKGKKTQK